MAAPAAPLLHELQWRLSAILPPAATASVVPLAGVIASSLAPSTWRTYSSHLLKFITFCAERDLSFLPAGPDTVLLYAYHLAQSGTVQARTAQPYFSCINTYHEMLGHPKPAADYPPFARFRTGWQRLQRPLVEQAPLQLAMRAASALHLARALPTCASVYDLRALLFVVMLFSTMLRPDSLLLSGRSARVSLVADS